MGNDKFGILKLHETKTDGLEWFNKWKRDDRSTRTLEEGDFDPLDSRFFLLCGSPNAPLKIDGMGRAIVKSQSSSMRLFVTGPWKNTEMTVYIKGYKACDDVQLRSRSNHQIACSFGNYECHWHRITKLCAIECETMHPIYQRHLDEKTFTPFPMTRYVGFKQVTRNMESNTKVKVEGYINTSSNDGMDQTKWVKTNEYIFDGSVTVPVQSDDNLALLASCTGQGDGVANNNPMSTLYLNEAATCWIRINNSDETRFKFYSIREIDPL